MERVVYLVRYKEKESFFDNYEGDLRECLMTKEKLAEHLLKPNFYIQEAHLTLEKPFLENCPDIQVIA